MSGESKHNDFRWDSRNNFNVIVPKPNVTVFRKCYYLFSAPKFLIIYQRLFRNVTLRRNR